MSLLVSLNMNKFVTVFIITCIFSTCYASPSSNEVEQTPSKQHIQEEPLNVALLSDEAVLKWANKRVIETYEFYFEDIGIWRKKIEPYFSNNGYKDFLATSMIDSVKKKKLIVQPKLKGEPALLVKGINKALVYTWYVVVPIEITYLGPQNKVQQNMLAKLEIVRHNNPGQNEYVVINSLTLYPNEKTPQSMEALSQKIKEGVTLN
jgi:hypothetical protein